MFDIGFAELLLIAVLGLLVLGPERLPTAVRTISLWLGRLRRSFTSIRQEIEREVGADEIRRQLHNESIMASLEDSKQSLRDGLESAADDIRSVERSLSRANAKQDAEDDTSEPALDEHSIAPEATEAAPEAAPDASNNTPTKEKGSDPAP
ncbi:Sec-independent protein translocase protein TatB [Spongiibacter sp. UBA1325]|jgi:sec-independent protein translocase protein TatB|uniref:Sec-independent protein translocase protein TatB n=1 Tax=Spongiibacter sp. UBA1325 TaxID=1947543 RepID=UPI00257EF9A9|nr:Sec-independent protein translocase protein TatB [Spongiibacter sp. UBA1325]|tara:strand:+ start:5609 stop:6061 length:453 start_codon:yes stop_codon:yes gene_type:complete